MCRYYREKGNKNKRSSSPTALVRLFYLTAGNAFLSVYRSKLVFSFNVSYAWLLEENHIMIQYQEYRNIQKSFSSEFITFRLCFLIISFFWNSIFIGVSAPTEYFFHFYSVGKRLSWWSWVLLSYSLSCLLMWNSNSLFHIILVEVATTINKDLHRSSKPNKSPDHLSPSTSAGKIWRSPYSFLIPCRIQIRSCYPNRESTKSLIHANTLRLI